MRKFNQTEQAIIRKLVKETHEHIDYLLINVYMDIFYQHPVEYNNGSLIFYSQGTHSAKEILEIEKKIIDISLLLSFLEENRYIYLIDDNSSESEKLKNVGGYFTEGLKGIGKKLDPKMSKIIENALNHRAFVSEDLIQLVKNDFKTVEEQTLEEAKKQSRNSHKSVSIAFIAVVISVLIPILSIIFSSNVVKIDSNQYEQLCNRYSNQENYDELAHQPQTDTL